MNNFANNRSEGEGVAPIHIAFRADDAGLCHGVDEGIEHVVRAGQVRNVSIMVPAPHFKEAALRFSRLDGIDLGLHVTLCCEWQGQTWPPILTPSQVPSLVCEGGVLPANPMELYERKASIPEMLAEVEAQLAVARANGLRIAYLDEHMGVGWLPGLRQALRELARCQGMVHADELPRHDALGKTLPGAGAFLQCVEHMQQLQQGDTGRAALLIVHPAADHPSTKAFRLAGETAGQPDNMANRVAERDVLVDAAFVSACGKSGVRPVRITELAAMHIQGASLSI